MRHYYIECDYCESETQVSTREEEEPEFCPHCGQDIRAELIDEMDDSA